MVISKDNYMGFKERMMWTKFVVKSLRDVEGDMPTKKVEKILNYAARKVKNGEVK